MTSSRCTRRGSTATWGQDHEGNRENTEAKECSLVLMAHQPAADKRPRLSRSPLQTPELPFVHLGIDFQLILAYVFYDP